MIQRYLFTKQKQTHRLREGLYGYGGWGCWWEGIVRESGIDRHTLLYLKWITNKVLLHSTGHAAWGSVASWMEGSLGENGYIYMYD